MLLVGLFDAWLGAQLILFQTDLVVSFEAVAHASAESKETLVRSGVDAAIRGRFGPVPGMLGLGSGDRVAVPAPSARATPVTEPPTEPGRELRQPVASSTGLTRTVDDPLSTFSVDVDTASYARARAAVTRGDLPEPAEIRAEEFVNALRYAYVGPQGDAPFAVNMAGAPHPWKPGRHLLRFGVQARSLHPDRRRPVHFTFLVDVSGSMEQPDKLPLVRQTLAYLVEQLAPDDSLALVTYAGHTELVLLPTPVVRRDEVQAAIERLVAGGGTNMGSGIELAYLLAQAVGTPGHENRVIIASDGDANVGAASLHELQGIVAGYAHQGITLTTLGFGREGFADHTMEQLAQLGDGVYHFIDGMDEARRVFGRDLAASLETVARDVKLQVAFEPDRVRGYRLLGYANRALPDEAFRVDAVDAGEVGAGHQVTALYEVELTERAEEGPLATVSVRAKPTGVDAAASEWRTRFEPVLLADTFAAADRDFRLAVGALALAQALGADPDRGAVDLALAQRIVDGARRPDVVEDAELSRVVELAIGAQAHARTARPPN